MAIEKYKEWKPQAKTLTLLNNLEKVIADFKARGFYPLSLRQIYYQAVARGYIANNDKEYNKMGYTVRQAREAGVWDWEAIEDRNRSLIENTHYEDPRERIMYAAYNYAIDKRVTQPNYIECWVEKAALIGVLEPVARKYDVPCFACRGFVSSTANHEAADRFKAQAHRQRRIILYGGDYDPDGFSIHQSVCDRLKMFGADVELIRIGLTEEQIKKYNPPPAPVKMEGKRAKGFIKEKGTSVWELDALDPQVIADLYAKEIEALTDEDLMEEARQRETKEQNMLYAVYQNWNRIESSFQAR